MLQASSMREVKFLGPLSDLPNQNPWHKCLFLCFNNLSRFMSHQKQPLVNPLFSIVSGLSFLSDLISPAPFLTSDNTSFIQVIVDKAEFLVI